MKALTIWQPWATLLAIGAKEYETRSWGTTYRGPIAIHSGLRPPSMRELTLLSGVRVPRSRLSLPLGVVLAVGYLEEIVSCTPRFRSSLSLRERRFGDFSRGRFAWRITEMRMLPEPIPWRGSMGLWEWDVGPRILSELATE